MVVAATLEVVVVGSVPAPVVVGATPVVVAATVVVVEATVVEVGVPLEED